MIEECIDKLEFTGFGYKQVLTSECVYGWKREDEWLYIGRSR